ncbi:phage tail length tape measure family protein [Methylobacterium sp. PvR107]|uniref:phage tail length tape measure family protein n=1 Tax=Methylobacterium sp. PvR107 TaxID=2806597 RepID=UPI001AE63B56|nr:phage tail length tape measure family protein [Methylobacterium sp. PvR107]MBP1179966.1 hypothetical protein [Methylobacterium sp. PvR107]
MADLDTIQEVRIVATTEGDQDAVRAMGQVGAAIDNVVVKTDNLSKAQISAQRQLDATARKYDQEYRALQDLARAQQVLDRARSQGLSGTDAFARAQDAVSAKLALVSQQTLNAAATIQQLAQASGAQSSINFSVGVADDFNAAARAKDIEAYGKSLDELQARFDPLFAAQQQYRAEVAAISEAEKLGALTQQQAAKAVDFATNRYNNQRIEIQKSEDANARLAKGVGLNAYAWQNLSYQVNDVVTSLASGISPFQTLAQQGGQIFQILQSGQGGVGGALKGIADRLLAINPLVGVFGALAVGLGLAAIAANNFAKAQRDVQLALLGSGQGAGLTADQIQALAEKASRSSTITVSAARDIEKAFLDGGKVYGEVFAKGITAADDFAKASKQDVGDAAKFIAGALSNLGGGGFEDLAKKAGNFDSEFEKTVREAIRNGDDLKAQQLVVERFGEAFDKASSKATGLQSILQRADQTFKNAAESFGKAVSQSFNGAPLQQQIDQLNAARKNAVAIGEASGQPADTSAIDSKIRRLTTALGEQTAVAQKNAVAVRANADANDKVVTSISAPVRSLKDLQDGYATANKAVNAFEAQQAAGVKIPVDQYNAAKESLAGYSAGIKAYALANGAAGIEAEKARKVLAAGLQTIQAVTPEQRAAAQSATVLANAFGTAESGTKRSREAAEAYKRSMAESTQATVNANRATDESAKTSNQLAEATVKQGNSIEFLRAKRQAETEAANGTISQSDVETRTKKILSEQIATLNAQRAADIRSARDSAGAQQRANDAVASGKLVSADAARQVQLYNQQAQLQREIDAATGDERVALTARLKELTAATEAQLDADKRAQVLSMSEETKRQIDMLTKEGELLGANNRDRAIAIAQLQAEQSLKRQGISITAPESIAYINQEKLKADVTYAKDQYTRLAQDISSAIGGIFDDLTSSGKKSFASFADSFSKGFSRIGSRVLEQNIIQPLISGGLDGKGGGTSSFFSNLQNLFDGQKLEKAISTGSEEGIFSGLKSLFGGNKSGASNGGFAMGGLGQGLAAAGIGGSIGYQSQSPLIGALGGAAAGFAVGNVPGALVGGAAGLIGGIFGESQAKKEAKKKLQQELQARREALEQARPQIEQLALMFEGGSIGNVGKQIADAEAQLRQAAKTASEGGDQALADKLMKDYQTYVARMTAVFADGFEGTLKEVRAGFGTSGPFAQALSQVQQLGEAIKGFVADSGRLGSSDAIARAREAAVEDALSQLDAPKELSSTETELSRIQGTAAGLNQVLKDLGFSADDTAKIINDRTIKALDALKDKFNDDLGRKINDAQNKSYLNDAADLIKEVAGLRADATSVGGDLGAVDTYFTAAAQKLVDGSQLVGSAFNDLIAKFPELQGKVHEYSETASMSADQAAKAAAQALSEIQDRKRGYEDRAFAVNFSDDSLSTKLTAFDRTAEWDQWTEMAKGGQALDDLIATQVLERNKLIADYNAAVKERQLTFQDRTFAATNDTTTLAGQLAEYDRKATQERVEEVKAGGDAIADLEQAQGAERLKIINDFAKQATDALNARLKGYADRYFTATNDSTTLGGQLDAYNRQALQEREDEIKAGGEALAELEQTQAAERLKIISDYGKQAADALKQQMDAAQTAFDAFAKNIKTFLDGLKTGTDSPLAPKDRLAEAQAQYSAQLALAQGGDRTALDNITQYASALLDASKAYNASSSAYQATFQQVQQTLAALPTQISAEQFIVNAITDSKVAVVTATQAMQAQLYAGLQANSPGLVAAALYANFAMLDTSVNGLLDFNEFLAGLGPLATSSEQIQARQIFNAIDANGDGQISKLEAANASSFRVEQYTAATNSNAAATSANAAATNNTVAVNNDITAGQSNILAQQNAILSGQNQLLDSINGLSSSQVQLQQQLVNLNASINDQNSFVQQNTARTNAFMAAQGDYYGNTYNVQSLMLNNLRSANAKNGAVTYATGGWISGPGTGTSDSIAARVSNGEFVVNAASARVYGPWLEAMNDNRFTMPALAMPMPVSAGMGGSDAMLAELRALREEVTALRSENREDSRMVASTTAAGARHVREGVDDHKAETRKGNTDRRQDASRPRTAGTKAA